MFIVRSATVIVGLLLISACSSPSATKPGPAPSTNPTSAASLGNVVLVGHTDSPATVTLMRLDGSIMATLPGVGVSDEHAVGAYLVLAGSGSTKGWTVDASGVVRDVAPAAVAILSPSINGGWTPPLIVDSSTAVIVRSADGTLTPEAVDLRTGTVRPLLASVPYTGAIGLPALTLLDVSSDRKTVWLGKITSTGAVSGRLEIIGIDLATGTVSSQGDVNALAGAEIAITRDGKFVAGQEYFGTDANNLASQHLHVLSLGTNVDSDVQGAAPYVGAQRTPSVLFAPGGALVAWWGGLNNGDRSFQVNVAPLGGPGRTLYNPAQADFSHSLSGVFWIDPAKLVVQNGLETYTIDASTGGETLVSQKLNYLDAVLN
jgi:hypothetical protein